MHPQIVVGDHACDQFMVALIRCHEASWINRFIGACNDEKASLDRCLREDKKRKVKASVAKAREKRKVWEERCAADSGGR